MVCGSGSLDLNELPVEDAQLHYVMLEKDGKPICRTRCVGLSFVPPRRLSILDFKPKARLPDEKLPCFQLYPEPEKTLQTREWVAFTDWISKKRMVGIVESESCNLYILPPNQKQELSHVEVLYQMKTTHPSYDNCEVKTSGLKNNLRKPKSFIRASPRPIDIDMSTSIHNDRYSHAPKPSRTDINSLQQEYVGESNGGSHPVAPMEDRDRKVFLSTNPSYLRTLSQTHGWIFGAIAELVDNSRDARANRLDISVESLYLKNAGKEVPVLAVVDDGDGMSHNEIVRMLSLGHKEPDKEDPDHIGRFGVGFKTGSMRLGRDVVVLTQTSSSRSIALLSQSFNENKETLEVPIITYRRHGNYMDVDLDVQSEFSAGNQLKAIKDFSPFNEYLIGERFGMYSKLGTGTQIYIWNLDKWGSDYTLEWNSVETVEGNFQEKHGDILIRSRKVQSRLGQISLKVPLDYSLKSYLEVIFLDPRIKIYVQGSLVKSRPLARSLSRTVVVTGHVMDKHIRLTLGRSQEEWERANCGIFLYWHGRLIEAYKRVGGMVHNSDMGRGVIGVVDVSSIMDGGKGHVWVLNNKQGFQDCEAYSRLQEWLGNKTDEYWDNNFDILDLRKGNAKYKPDHEWVQCDKCRKWRILNSGFDSKILTKEWFCYMPPFSGKCELPEQEAEPGVITVSAKRFRGDTGQRAVQCDAIEVVDNTFSPSGSKYQSSKQSGCSSEEESNWMDDSTWKPREACGTKHIKGKRIGFRSSNHKNMGKDGNREDSRKNNKETPAQPNFKRLRKGLLKSCD